MSEILLRDVVESDIAVFFGLQRDEVSAHMAAFGTRDPSAVAHAARWKKNRDAGTTVNRTIVKDGKVVGFVARFMHDDKPQVTYWVAREHWGTGVATHALRELIHIVTERPLYASAAKDNIGSLRVLEKCGFEVTGSERAFAEARSAEVEEVFLILR